MTTLTKEYLDEKLVGLATVQAVEELKKSLTEQNYELVRMVAEGFVDVIVKLGGRGELGHLKLEFQDMKDKLEHALHVQL